MRAWVLAAVVWSGAAQMGMAQAGPLPEGGVTAGEVAEVMRGMKLGVEQTTDSRGNPLIYSAVGGRKFGVYFYECKAVRCASIQFSAGFEGAASVPMTKAMEWNRTKRFGRAYLDGGRLFVEMDMDVERGTTSEAVANNFERWAAVMEQFPKYFE
jgi:hypothetical protein